MKTFRILMACLLPFLAVPDATGAEPPSADAVLGAVVGLQATIAEDGRTVDSLGPYREGHGVVIDGSGLVLTIGYLIMEAESVSIVTADGTKAPAHVVAYDHATGFGLVRAEAPLGVRPMAIGSSADAAEGDAVLVAGSGGPHAAVAARIASRRSFAGYWEYLLEDAIFTMPPHRSYGGAALIDSEGRLIGIGSLMVNDAPGEGERGAGNMFVPIDLLKPILADLIAIGRAGGPRPWLGLYIREVPGGLYISRVAVDGPAQLAGVLPGSLLLALDGESVGDLEEFYRRVWRDRAPGDRVRIAVVDPTGEGRELDIVTADRHDWLRIRRGK